jgi:hypothetical protein
MLRTEEAKKFIDMRNEVGLEAKPVNTQRILKRRSDSSK